MSANRTVRNFDWQDFDPLVEVINATWGQEHPDHPTEPAVLRGWLKQPGSQPERDCFVAEVDGRLGGYALLTPELPVGRGVVAGGVHPDFRRRGEGRRLLRTVVARARELGLTHVDVCGPPPGNPASALLTGEGFSPVRVHWHMHWSGGPLEPPSLPQGYTLRSFSPGDEARLTEIQNSSFHGTWGFSPNTVEQIAYRIRLPGTRPEGIVLLAHGQEVVGYNWTRLEGAPDRAVGIIFMTGVAPSHRGRGLGRVVVVAGMRYLQELGIQRIELTVDRDNDPARQLYLSLGFQPHRESHWYQLVL